MKEIFYLNGKLLPRDEAKISLLDYGFLFGFGLYETMRAYDGKPFRLENHLARLRYSGERLGIVIHTALIREAVHAVIKANGFGQTRLRICVSIGEGEIAPNLDSCKHADRCNSGFGIQTSESCKISAGLSSGAFFDTPQQSFAGDIFEIRKYHG